MVVTYGTKPTGYKAYYSEDAARTVDVGKKDIYGAKFSFDAYTTTINDPSHLANYILNTTVQKIRSRGDEPVYVEVELEPHGIIGGIIGTYWFTAKVTFFARKLNGGTPVVVLVAFAVAAILGGIAAVIHEYRNLKYYEWYIKYYKEHGEPPNPPSPPGGGGGAEDWAKTIETILLIILIIYILKEARR